MSDEEETLARAFARALTEANNGEPMVLNLGVETVFGQDVAGDGLRRMVESFPAPPGRVIPPRHEVTATVAAGNGRFSLGEWGFTEEELRAVIDVTEFGTYTRQFHEHLAAESMRLYGTTDARVEHLPVEQEGDRLVMRARLLPPEGWGEMLGHHEPGSYALEDGEVVRHIPDLARGAFTLEATEGEAIWGVFEGVAHQRDAEEEVMLGRATQEGEVNGLLEHLTEHLRGQGIEVDFEVSQIGYCRLRLKVAGTIDPSDQTPRGFNVAEAWARKDMTVPGWSCVRMAGPGICFDFMPLDTAPWGIA
jgi:hypothetical protein